MKKPLTEIIEEKAKELFPVTEVGLVGAGWQDINEDRREAFIQCGTFLLPLIESQREEAVKDFKIKLSKKIMSMINYKDNDTEREIGKYDGFCQIVEKLLTSEK